MAQIASEALIERLADWGVDTVFGLPGDGINGIMEGLRKNSDRVRFVLVHHEEAAAFMATAHAKATGAVPRQDRAAEVTAGSWVRVARRNS
jgi:pyruvate dehydrogenase (quinone)